MFVKSFFLILLNSILPCLSEFAVFGYLPEYRYQTVNYTTLFPSLTHLIFFSIEVSRTGELSALDRFPSPPILQQAKQAAVNFSGKLLISLGGNSRTNGFPIIVHSEELRSRFIDNILKLVQENELDGVDFNWEYPRDQEDWNGLFVLIKQLKDVFRPLKKIITMAYYPDGNQEMILSQSHASDDIDYFLSMSYDTYHEHSTYQFSLQTINNAKIYLPLPQTTLGIPFYGRNIQTGYPRTYSELYPFIRNYKENSVKFPGEEQGLQFFNSKEFVKEKIRLARSEGLAGIMIWEVGQDVGFEEEGALLRGVYEELGFNEIGGKRDNDEL